MVGGGVRESALAGGRTSDDDGARALADGQVAANKSKAGLTGADHMQ